MITSPLPQLRTNYNKRAFVLALCLYLPLFACAFISKSYSPKSMDLSAQGISLSLSQIQRISQDANALQESMQTQSIDKIVPQVKRAEPVAQKEQVKEVEPVKKTVAQKKATRKERVKRHKVRKERTQQHHRKPIQAQAQVQAQNTAVAHAKSQPLQSVMNKDASASSGVSPHVKAQTKTELVYGRDSHPYLNALKSAIDASLIYPRKARAMRLEGTVLVSFRVENGKVSNVKVIKSSGKQVLDKAAIKSIYLASRRISAYSKALNIKIPIVYKLT